ncbi:hypothetical protein DPMN_003933 [Dreissena polymorpha]|uniref:Uncharacterized protein n=1 Tax=Dreissena polymorpha TaxID=45954 RepID=A0A9D4RSI8_DREPO|nr:hypothetical protein DPMN_003933 [Dreissena polymorpha]
MPRQHVNYLKVNPASGISIDLVALEHSVDVVSCSKLQGRVPHDVDLIKVKLCLCCSILLHFIQDVTGGPRIWPCCQCAIAQSCGKV